MASTDNSLISVHLTNQSIPFPVITNNNLILGSIDPGYKDFGFRIEQWNNFPHNVPIALAYDNYNTKEKDFNPMVLVKISQYLEHNIRLLASCHQIVIEKQVKESITNIRIMQHVITFLQSRLAGSPIGTQIIEQDSKLKTKMLNCPSAISGKRRIKKWSTIICTGVLRTRNDQTSLRILESNSKKDDLSDIVIQIIAYLIYIHWLPPLPKYTKEQITEIITLCN